MKLVWRIVAAVVLIALLGLMTPGAVPSADAETAPEYIPATLTAEHVTPIPYTDKTPYAPKESCYLPDNAGYLDSTISVRIEKMYYNNTDVWLAWVQIADPSQLRTASYKPYKSTAKSMAPNIAKREKAVLTINGDYFVDRKEGYIVRNGVELRDNYYEGFDALLVDDKGDLHVLRNPSEDSIRAYAGHIVHAFSFGPGLVIDGVRQTEFNGRIQVPTHRTQRMAFCQMDTLSYLLIAAEGPEQSKNGGLTMEMLADLAYELGAQQAYNMDGGSSTWLVLGGTRINAPKGQKRPICDIVYFITAEE